MSPYSNAGRVMAPGTPPGGFWAALVAFLRKLWRRRP
jgi:hypothetical protein